MAGEIVVVTGAGSGLGACIARRFSAAGDTVALLGRTELGLRQTAEKLPGKSAVYRLDVSDPAQVWDTFERIYRELGTVDRLVNCAGVGVFGPAESIRREDVDAMIDTNLKGTIYATQAVLPRMRAADAGYLINVISLSGIRANPAESVYCASKFGVEGFSKAVALELAGTRVRVSNFYMGNMATNLWHGERASEQPSFIRPEDMADLIYESTRTRPNLVVEEVRVGNFIQPERRRVIEGGVFQ